MHGPMVTKTIVTFKKIIVTKDRCYTFHGEMETYIP